MPMTCVHEPYPSKPVKWLCPFFLVSNLPKSQNSDASPYFQLSRLVFQALRVIVDAQVMLSVNQLDKGRSFTLVAWFIYITNVLTMDMILNFEGR
jgi:hypothetical protein